MIGEFQALIQLACQIYDATQTMPEAKKSIGIALRKTELVATLLEEFSKKEKRDKKRGKNEGDDSTILPFLKEVKKDMERINDLVKKTTKMNDLIYLFKAKGIQADTKQRMGDLNLSLNTLNTKLNIGQRINLHHDMQDKEDMEKAIKNEEEKNNKLEKILKMKEGEERTSSLRCLGHIKTQDDLEETIVMMEKEQRRTQELARQATEEIARDKAKAEASMMKQIIAVLEQLHESKKHAVTVKVPRCPISKMPMKDPVIVDSFSHCGHTFERDSIETWLRHHKKRKCPLCLSELDSIRLTPNADLRRMIEEANVLGTLANPSSSSNSSTDSPNATTLPDESQQSSTRGSNGSERENRASLIEDADEEEANEDVDEDELTVGKNTFWDRLKRRKVTVVALSIVLLSSIIAFASVFGGQTPPPTPFPVSPPPTPAPTTPPTPFPVSPPPPTPAPTTPPTPFPVSPPPTPAPTTIPRCIWPDFRACSSTVELVNEDLPGTIPTDIGLWTQLEYLSLRQNLLAGQIPTEIGLLTSISFLHLSGNFLGGTIPSEIGALTLLIDLRLDVNRLMGTIPREIGALTALTSLGLYENQLTGTIPSEIGALTSLTQLNLDRNELTGTIPSEIGALTGLTNLGLDQNQLMGTIPSEIGAFTSLLGLDLSSNQLTGTIPSEVGALTSLTQLDLYRNELTGTIPSEIGAFTALTYLEIYHNQLTGTIPSEIGAFTGLLGLDLSSNQLTGTIPSEIGAMTSLFYLMLYENQLTGIVPTSPCVGLFALVIDCEELECTSPCLCEGYKTDSRETFFDCPAT